MIKTELLKDGKLIRHYSDTPGMGLLQEDTGVKYGEAVDINPTNHVYREIPMPRPKRTTKAQIAEANEALRILTGEVAQ